MSRLRGVLVDHFRCWHVALVPEVLGMAAIEGQPDPLRDREDSHPKGLAQDRGSSQIYRLECIAGSGIIVPWRTNSAHLHRPRRAILRQSATSRPAGTFVRNRFRKAEFTRTPGRSMAVF